MSKRRKPAPRVPHKAPHWQLDIPMVIWRHTLGAEHRLDLMEEVSRLKLAAGESMAYFVRKVVKPSKIVIAKTMPGVLEVAPSILLGPDSKPIGAAR